MLNYEKIQGILTTIIASFILVENNRNNVMLESIIDMFNLQEVILRRSMLLKFIKWKKNMSIF
jgi:hypothetical protein